jgi:hypothetical protein
VIVCNHRERDKADAERDIDTAIHIGGILRGRALLHDLGASDMQEMRGHRYLRK